MKARFATRCAVCERNHIKIGDEIGKYFGRWAAKDCIDSEFETFQLTRRIEYDMLVEHKIHCGILDCPEGAKATDTRRKFYTKALELGLCTNEEYERIRGTFKYIWNKDLAD